MSRHHETARHRPGMTALTIATYGDRCWLRMPGCTRVATTRDHVRPLAHGGHDVIENLRPACRKCNGQRQDRIVSDTIGVHFAVVMGPPAAGKSTYVLDHAQANDIIIDLDRIARALLPEASDTHRYPLHVRRAAIAARRSAIQSAQRCTVNGTTVWIIHAMPKPAEVQTYEALRYELVTIDPGREIVEARARELRPAAVAPVIGEWYERATGSATEIGARPW